MASMSYDEYERFGWRYASAPSKGETASKFFTDILQHQKGKLLHNLKWGFPKSAAADPEWLKDYIKQNGPHMYHATDFDAAQKILQEGLYPHDHGVMPSNDDVVDCPHCGYSAYRDDFNEDDPGYCPSCGENVSSAGPASRSSWAGKFQQPRSGHAYLGSEKYAAPYLKFGGQMLKVDLRKLDPSKMNADEDHFVQHSNTSPLVNQIRAFDPPPSPDYYHSERGETLGDWADRLELGHNPEETHHSMSQGSMAYNGHIPPEAISLYDRDRALGWGDTDPGPPQVPIAFPPPPSQGQQMEMFSATDANHYEAKMYHGSGKGLLREIKTPFVTTDIPTDHPVSHPVSVTFKRPAHHFAPALTPEMIDMYSKAGHDGIVAHRPEGNTWAIALDSGTVVPGHDHDFPYK